MEVNSYDRTWFLRSLAASPLFIAAFLELWSWQVSAGRCGRLDLLGLGMGVGNACKWGVGGENAVWVEKMLAGGWVQPCMQVLDPG